MLTSLISQFQDHIALSARLFNEGVERQVKFAAEIMSIGAEGGRQVRSSKSLTELLGAQKSYLESVHAEVTNLNTGITTALKELSNDVSEAITSAVQEAITTAVQEAKAAVQEAITTATQDVAVKTDKQEPVTKATTEAAGSKKTTETAATKKTIA